MKRSSGNDATAFPHALREAIDAQDVTLAWLRDRLADTGNPVALATLSYWRSGQRRPEGAQSLAAVTAIEELLGLDEGALLALLPPSVRVGPVAAPESFHPDAVRAAVRETIEALDATPVRNLRDLSANIAVDVDAQGRLRRRHSRILLQATSGTVREIPYTDSAAEPSAVPLNIEAVAGARVIRRHDHASGLVFGVVFELDTPLTAPETALIEWVTEVPEDFPPIFEVGHGVARKNRETIIWVRFSPDGPPRWVEEFSDDGSPPQPRELGPGFSVHAVRRGFGPGSFGLRWGYDDRG